MWVKYADDDYFVMIWVDENLQNNVNTILLCGGHLNMCVLLGGKTF